jgi:hypothetical protein
VSGGSLGVRASVRWQFGCGRVSGGSLIIARVKCYYHAVRNI